MADAIIEGRDALARHSWEEAYQALARAEADEGLSPDDLALLADAAWWSGRGEDAVAILERAYAGHIKAGSRSQAAGVALRLAERAVRSLTPSVAQGWLGRADTLLEGEPESGVNAWYEFVRTAEASMRNDPETAVFHADRAIDIGKRHDELDVQTIALSFKGAAVMRLGRIEEGLALIDEAAAAATAGGLAPKTACDVYCFTIAACRDLSDIQRATEWTQVADRFMERESLAGYPGVCRVHRAELKRLHGHWEDAENEARSAFDELERFRLLDVLGSAWYEIGEVRLRSGDLDGAAEAFRQAYEFGTDPQPGLSLSLLAQGKGAEAARSLDRSLNDPGDGLRRDAGIIKRARLLPALVEVSLALGDLDAASSATAELEGYAEEHGTPFWQACSRFARGLVLLHQGDPDAAIGSLDRAWRRFRDLELPYEAARARGSLGEARRLAGDESGATLELRAALAAFEELGAIPDISRVESLLGIRSEAEPSPERITKTFMFTDIVRSTELLGVLGDEAWDRLLGWHDRTLRNAFEAHGGEVVSHTGDGFFVAFDDPRTCVECAVSVQRLLRRHRDEHGFAPWVRIGVHTSEANRQSDNYIGRGVHLASRVASVAGGDEIVISGDSLAGIGELSFEVGPLRSVEVKGVAEPITVCNVDWA